MSILIEKIVHSGKTTEFFRFGSGEKTLVILPGLSVQSVMPFAGAIEEAYSVMKEKFTVFVFDRRSELPGNYSFDDMVKDVSDAIDALGLSDIYLFGASQGGMIAFRIAAQRPGLVKKLAVASSAIRLSENESDVVRDWIKIAEEGDGVSLYLEFGKRVYPSEYFEKNRDALIFAGKSVTKDELRRFAILARTILCFDPKISEKDIKCPLFAAGAEDDGVLGGSAIRRISREFKARPDFESHIYNGYGHALYDLAPDFKQKLSDFFCK